MDARTRLVALGTGSLLVLGAASAPPAGGAWGQTAAPATAGVDPADFVATIDHPLFPLTGMRPKLLVGEGQDPATDRVSKQRVELRVSPAPELVAGVEVTVLEEFAYVDGRLHEHSRDYFAQGEDGTVYLFGERVDHFRDGAIIDQPGTWLVGQDVPEPMVYLPAALELGQTFRPEVVPGLVEDVATVVALDESVTTAAGTFDGCATLRVEDELSEDVVDRTLCAGVGLVREEPPAGAGTAGQPAEEEEAGDGEGVEGEAPEGGVELVKLGG